MIEVGGGGGSFRFYYPFLYCLLLYQLFILFCGCLNGGIRVVMLGVCPDHVV